MERKVKGSKMVDAIVNLTNAEVKGLTKFLFCIFIEKAFYNIFLSAYPPRIFLGLSIQHHVLSFSLFLESNQERKRKQT